ASGVPVENLGSGPAADGRSRRADSLVPGLFSRRSGAGSPGLGREVSAAPLGGGDRPSTGCGGADGGRYVHGKRNTGFPLIDGALAEHRSAARGHGGGDGDESGPVSPVLRGAPAESGGCASPRGSLRVGRVGETGGHPGSGHPKRGWTAPPGGQSGGL